ncbi:DUF1156 domain-containing protein [Paracoccus mutanolyticus]
MHLWWARRPLAACRAVLFAQQVDVGIIGPLSNDRGAGGSSASRLS